MSKKGNFLKMGSVIMVLYILVSVFASCGASKGLMYDDAKAEAMNGIASTGGYMGFDDMPMLEVETSDVVNSYYSKSEAPEAETVEVNDPLSGRKIIKTVNIVSETKELDNALARIEGEVAALGGYIQSSNTYGKSYEKYSNRRANYTLRIPAESLSTFMSNIGGYVNITSKTEKVDDITDTYTDIEARLEALKTQETRLIELLAKAEKLEDIITLEERISYVRYEIESYEARIRNYNTLIAFSTVNIELAEVIDYTPEPIKDPTFGDRIGEAFRESWKDFAEGCKDFSVGLVYALPTLLVLAVIALVIVFIIVGIAKRSRKNRANMNMNIPPQNNDNI